MRTFFKRKHGAVAPTGHAHWRLTTALSGLLLNCYTMPEIAPAPTPVTTEALPSDSSTQPPTSNGQLGENDTNTAEISLPLKVIDLVQDTNLTLRVNSRTTCVTQSGDQRLTATGEANDTLRVQVSEQPRGQTCVVAVPGTSLGDAQAAGIVVTCRVSLRFSGGMSASLVLGQTSFTENANLTSPTAKTLRHPRGSASSPPGSNLVFLADFANNRIIGYPTPLKSFQAASVVVGQVDFTSNFSPPTTACTLNAPNSVYGDGYWLVASEDYTSRVVLYPNVPTDVNAAATLVFGANDFTSSNPSPGCSATAVNAPRAAILVNGALVVADSNNSRVLIWNTFSADQPRLPAPDIILGCGFARDANGTWSKKDPTKGMGDANWCPTGYKGSIDKNNPEACITNSILSPRGMHWDGEYFYVADSLGNRLLVWKGLPTANVQANWVLGQPDFATIAASTGPTDLNAPQAVTADSQHIWVSDSGNHRVLAYDRSQLANGMPATYSLGQAGTGILSDTSQSAPNMGSATPDANTLSDPHGVAIIGVQLLVTDTGNHRLLVFDSD